MGAVHFAIVGVAGAVWLVQRDWRAVGGISLAVVISLVLSLLTRYGVDLWLTPLTTARAASLAVNADWTPLRPFSPSDLAYTTLLCLLLVVGLGRSVRGWIALALVLPAIHAARLSPYAALFTVVFVVERIAERWPRLQVSSPVRSATLIPIFAVMFLMVAFIPSRAVPTIAAASLPGVRSLPSTAVDRLLACSDGGAVWNDFNWGGYLLWHGDGRYTVGIDGRGDTFYADTAFDRYFTIIRGQEGWQRAIIMTPATYVLLASDGPDLATLPGFRVVYQDTTAQLAARDGAVWRCSHEP